MRRCAKFYNGAFIKDGGMQVKELLLLSEWERSGGIKSFQVRYNSSRNLEEVEALWKKYW